MEENREDLLERTYALAKENNRLLKKLRHGTWIGLIFKLLFWAVMLGVPIWMYFTVLQPVIQQGMGVLEQVQGVAGKAGVQTDKVQGLLNSLNSIPGMDVFNQLSH